MRPDSTSAHLAKDEARVHSLSQRSSIVLVRQQQQAGRGLQAWSPDDTQHEAV